LLKEDIFIDAFPLHDGDFNLNSNSNPRSNLRDNWANYACWFKFQPIDHIREYFGEKIAIYFIWLGSYTIWLLLPAIVGLVVFLINFFSKSNDITS
jgi:anoctamin-7